MFFITCFEKCEKDECGCFHMGDTRTFRYFDTLETCKQALNENWCDMHEGLYEFAVIENIGQGIHPRAKEIAWFRWDDEKGGFYEIKSPNGQTVGVISRLGETDNGGILCHTTM